MRSARIISTTAFLVLVFVVQESLISRINFPVSGFSLYIAVLMGLISLEDRAGAIVTGFIGGLILDLSPTIDAPLGQWALVMTVMGYLFSVNRETIGDFATRPAALIFFVALGAATSLFLFLLSGLMLGENNGAISKIALIVAGNSLWTVLFSPLILPVLSRLRAISLSSRDRA